MKWVTRSRIRLDRSACAWLILRHIDPGADIRFVEADGLDGAIAEGALPFHATVAEDPDPGERTSFDMLLTEYKLDQQDAALVLMSEIVHGAEMKEQGALAEAEGVRAIAKGMNALVGSDQEMVARMLPVFDALEAYCRRRAAGQRGWANAAPPGVAPTKKA